MSRILVIEDDKNIRETLVDLLNMQGYDAIQAGDGEIGCIKAMKFIPDLILCDVNMPKMNGFQLLEVLNQLMDEAVIPVFLFISARVEAKDIRHGISLGADDYLTKPFTNTELLNSIESKLSKREKFVLNILQKERARISGDLHDSTQQLLSSALIGFKRLESKIELFTQADQRVYNTSLEILNIAINDIRNISHEMVAEKSESLQKMVNNIIEPLQNSSNIKFQYNYALQDLQLPEKMGIEMLRMLQECIINILKHANAKEVEISLREATNGGISIYIKDDGKGFDINKKSEGIGIKNLINRVHQLNGTIDINSANGIGTSIDILIPDLSMALNQKARQAL